MNKKKILIVDDENDTLTVLEKGLTGEGYSVITASNGRDGVNSARSNHPDLIILDIFLPDISGNQVAEMLKEEPGTRDIPVIFLSCLFSKEFEKEKDNIADGNIFFAKPYDAEQLSTEIEKLLSKRSNVDNKEAVAR